MVLTGGKQNYSVEGGGGDLFPSHLVQNKSHIGWPVIEAGPPG